MANSKNKRTKGDASTTTLDPFASVVEPSSTPKSTRPAPAATRKKTASEGSRPATLKQRTSQPAVKGPDAFAEVASASPAKLDEQVVLELPPDTSVKKKRVRTAKNTTVTATSPVRPETTASEPPKARSASKASAAKRSSRKAAAAATVSDPTKEQDVTAAIAATEPKVELSPVFKELADVKLPKLPPENRARLQMQSPTRLYFYWSLKQNPWQQLRAVFGKDLGNYTLVVKLRNLTTEQEEIHPIETQGEWWFDGAEPDCKYVAEVGFYATSRPYFRVLYSNTVTTPRRTPSPNPDTEARWTVSATKFAEVLDASGFTRDAVDVAIAGDDHLDADHRTRLAFSEIIGRKKYSTRGIRAEDMRYAMLALAGGVSMAELRSRVSSSLFNVLQAGSRVDPASAREALASHFDIEQHEWIEQEFSGAVFGASRINFPRSVTTRRDSRYRPVSSHSLG